MTSIISNYANICLIKTSFCFCLDFNGDPYLGAWRPLKLHDDGVEHGVERLDRPNHVEIDRAVEPARLALSCGTAIDDRAVTRHLAMPVLRRRGS